MLEIDPGLAWRGLAGAVFLELNVPRIGSRIDTVLISGPAIFAIEFELGETEFNCEPALMAGSLAGPMTFGC